MAGSAVSELQAPKGGALSKIPNISCQLTSQLIPIPIIIPNYAHNFTQITVNSTKNLFRQYMECAFYLLSYQLCIEEFP